MSNSNASGVADGFESLIGIMRSDALLASRLSPARIDGAAAAATGIHAIIVEVIRDLGLADDGVLAAGDVRAINAAIRGDASLFSRYDALRDSSDLEAVLSVGGFTKLFGIGAIEGVGAAVWNIGLPIANGSITRPGGSALVDLDRAAWWFEALLADDLGDGSLLSADGDRRIQGTTGTGLDAITDAIASDLGYQREMPTADLARAVDGIDRGFKLLLEGLRAVGATNNGSITASDLYDLNAWIRSDPARLAAYEAAAGSGGLGLLRASETSDYSFGERTGPDFAAALLLVGRPITGEHFMVNGRQTETLEDVAARLDMVLTRADLTALVNSGVDNVVRGTTGTRLDNYIDVINTDPGLVRFAPTSAIAAAAKAADALNHMIIEGIRAVGAAEDASLVKVEVQAINQWIRSDPARLERYLDLYGVGRTDGGGFLQITGRDAQVVHEDFQLVDRFFGGTYAIGMPFSRGLFDHPQKSRFPITDSEIASWTDHTLAADFVRGALSNERVDPRTIDANALRRDIVFTNAGVTVDNNRGFAVLEEGRNLRLAQGTVVFSFVADAPDGEEVHTLFAKDGGSFATGGNTDIFVQRGALFARMRSTTAEVVLEAYGLIEAGVEYDFAFTFDGAKASMYLNGVQVDSQRIAANWLTNGHRIALGVDASSSFALSQHHDGLVSNVQVLDRALTASELAAFRGEDRAVPQDDRAVTPPTGTTGTGLDRIVRDVYLDLSLFDNVSVPKIISAAVAADRLNAMLVEGIRARGLANDGELSTGDIRELSNWIAESPSRKAMFLELHGTGNGETGTGFQTVRNSGGEIRRFGAAAIDTVYAALYDLGYGSVENLYVNNGSGGRGAALGDISLWLNTLLENDLAAARLKTGSLYSSADLDAIPLTGTELDRIALSVRDDERLSDRIATGAQREAAQAVGRVIEIIHDAIEAQGLDDDGVISGADLRLVANYIRARPSLDAEIDQLRADVAVATSAGTATRWFGRTPAYVLDGLSDVDLVTSAVSFTTGNRNTVFVDEMASWIDDLLFRPAPVTASPRLDDSDALMRVNGVARAITSFDSTRTADRQDFGDFTVSNDRTAIIQSTNSWEQVFIDYTTTADTVLRFEFSSTDEGEIHAIGLESDNTLTGSRFFKVLGTQNFGNTAFDNLYAVGDGPRAFEIRLGQFFGAGLQIDRLVFVTDDDAGPSSNSRFANVTISEGAAPPPANALLVNGVARSVRSFDDFRTADRQDFGDCRLSNDGRSIIQSTNAWDKVDFAYTVTANTRLAFEFRSTDEGEIHAIGLENNDTATASRFFKVLGVQDWGNAAFDDLYAVGDSARSYEIAVADFLGVGATFDRIVFATDDDAGPSSNSTFSNIRVFESAVAQTDML